MFTEGTQTQPHGSGTCASCHLAHTLLKRKSTGENFAIGFFNAAQTVSDEKSRVSGDQEADLRLLQRAILPQAAYAVCLCFQVCLAEAAKIALW